MKHRRLPALILPLLALGLGVSACGGSSGSPGSSGGGDDSSEGAGYRVLTLVSAPGAGGTATDTLTWLDDPGAQESYAAQFKGRLKEKLTAAFGQAKAPAGEDLFAAIVAVGCGAPSSAVVFDSFEGVVVSPSPSPSASGCPTPTTTVAIVAGPPPQ